MLELNYGVADDGDLRAVHKWLIEAKERVGHSFICNWDSAVERHRARRGLIHVARDAGGPIAFITSPVTIGSIMEVHLDRRGMGVGRRLVAHVEGVAESEGSPIFIVEAVTEDSEAFWRRLGYADMYPIGRGASGPYLVKTTGRQLQMPDGVTCEIAIEIRDNRSEWWSDSAGMLAKIACQGTWVEDECRIYLERRVVVPEFVHCPGPWIGLQVPDLALYRQRMRWAVDDEIGIQECSGGFYIDYIDTDILADTLAKSPW